MVTPSLSLDKVQLKELWDVPIVIAYIGDNTKNSVMKELITLTYQKS